MISLLACQINMACARRGPSLGRTDSLARVDLVRRAEAGELGVRLFESFHQSVAASFHRLDAACLEQAPGETRARREVGGAAKASEEHLGPLPGAGEVGVAPVAQVLEGLGEPEAGERRDGFTRRQAGW